MVASEVSVCESGSLINRVLFSAIFDSMLAHSQSEVEETPSHLSVMREAILTPDLFLTLHNM